MAGTGERAISITCAEAGGVVKSPTTHRTASTAKR